MIGPRPSPSDGQAASGEVPAAASKVGSQSIVAMTWSERSGRDTTWPARYHWNAKAAFEQLALHAGENGHVSVIRMHGRSGKADLAEHRCRIGDAFCARRG